jgi:Spy/CpxP family protein refolding chaperone
MKRDWLLYLVIFSLALNLGTIGTFAYLRYQDHREMIVPTVPPPLPMRELWGRLHLDDGQRQALGRLLPEHRRRVQELRGDLAQKRQELMGLIKGEAPAWQPLLGKIREISELQGKLEEEMVKFLLEVQKLLRPEQKTAFLGLLERRLLPGRGGMGRPCGPPGPPRGPGPLGPGPGPGCPMPPGNCPEIPQK